MADPSNTPAPAGNPTPPPALAGTHDRCAVDAALLVVRILVGVIFAIHGSQKLFGAFDGPGLSAMMKGMGPVLGFLVTIGEFFGGLGIIFGFLSRFSAASIIVIMIGAIVQVHGKNGFFANHNGYELHLTLIANLACILIAGPGRFAVGRYLPLPKSSRTGRPLIGLE